MLSVRRSGTSVSDGAGYRCHWVGQTVQWTTVHGHSTVSLITELRRYTTALFLHLGRIWVVWRTFIEVTELRLTTAAVKTHSTSILLPSPNTVRYFNTPQAPNSEWEMRMGKKIKFGHIRSCACM
jgi:hypothetical protein